MPRNLFLLSFALAGIGSASTSTPVKFALNEPVMISGVPSVTLGPGKYVLRRQDSAAGLNVVQVLNERQDYVYTTVLTIPATRPQPDDRRQFVFSESPGGSPPALHFWFPPGETSGQEFLISPRLFAPQLGAEPKSLQVRPGGRSQAMEPLASTADLYALRNVLAQIENGKFGAARDSFMRNYYLAQNREGAITSFLLALLMTDSEQAIRSLELVHRFDPARSKVLSDLDVYTVIQSLPAARKDLKGSRVRRLLLNFAMEMNDDTIARTAILAFERHVLNGDSLPVEMALDRRREELARRKRHEEQWTLAKEQIAKLNDCVKSLLNQVGALEYSARVEATVGQFGSVKFRVVLNRQRLQDLDVIVERSQRTICDRHSKLERLISQRNAAVARELDALRSALRELDRQPGSTTRNQYEYLRNWEGARASGVSRDLMMLAEAANSPLMRPSNVFRADRGNVQMNVAGSLARLAEWAERQ